MELTHLYTDNVLQSQSLIVLLDNNTKLKSLNLRENEITFIESQFSEKNKVAKIHSLNTWKVFLLIDSKDEKEIILESIRRMGADLIPEINQNKFKKVALHSTFECEDSLYALGEGLILANYQFLKYFSDKAKRENSLNGLAFSKEQIDYDRLKELCAVTRATKLARDLVNEPLSYLTATQLAEECKIIAQAQNVEVEVLEKQQIQDLKMGGLLGVNQGSIDPPTFTVLTYKHPEAVNEKPIVFVGKGVVYDTGGLSLKPTPNSMDMMKSDMGGAAAVAGVIAAIASAKLPVHVISLIPATDNRPSGNAYAPGDVLIMMNGKTVEVLNTDAEGRLILADALSYADRFNPELVVDVATLTGAAAMAVGSHGTVVMGTAKDETFASLANAGSAVCERTVQFPFFAEYGEALESDVADMKNIGTREGGAISAGKFLEHFVTGDWMHLDIAGPAFLMAPDGYRPKGGTGVGVRLLYQFLKNRVKNSQ